MANQEYSNRKLGCSYFFILPTIYILLTIFNVYKESTTDNYVISKSFKEGNFKKFKNEFSAYGNSSKKINHQQYVIACIMVENGIESITEFSPKENFTLNSLGNKNFYPQKNTKQIVSSDIKNKIGSTFYWKLDKKVQEAIYNVACNLIDKIDKNDIKSIDKIRMLFDSCREYKDASVLEDQCIRILAEYYSEKKDYIKSSEYLLEASATEKNIKVFNKNILLAVRNNKASKIKEIAEQSSDSSLKTSIHHFLLKSGFAAIAKNDYGEAINSFFYAENMYWRDNSIHLRMLNYGINIKTGKHSFETCGYSSVYKYFNTNSKEEVIEQCRKEFYKMACLVMEEKEYSAAIALFTQSNNYKDAKEKIIECRKYIAK